MKIFGKEIEDTCQYCGEVLTCELFRAGHGIGQDRSRITEMLRCQLRYEERYLRNKDDK